MSTPAVSYDKEQLDRAVRSVEQQFRDSVERIRYSVGEDWTYAPAIYYRVLLKDAPYREGVWRDQAGREGLGYFALTIQAALAHESGSPDFFHYCRFRTVSEQDRIRESEWN